MGFCFSALWTIRIRTEIVEPPRAHPDAEGRMNFDLGPYSYFYLAGLCISALGLSAQRSGRCAWRRAKARLAALEKGAS